MPYSPMQLAEVFIQTGELADALDALDQHLEATPKDDAARRLRAAVRLRLRGNDDLLAALDDLNHLQEPTVVDMAMRSIVLEGLGDLDGAIVAAEAAREADLADERGAERLFHLLLRARRFDAAQALIAAMPRTWDWLQRAGDLATEDGHEANAPRLYGEALAHLETRFDTERDDFGKAIKANLLAARGQAFATLKQFAQADADYTAAMGLMPDDPMLRFMIALVAADLGQMERALESCRAALAAANPTFREVMSANLQLLSAQPQYTPLLALLPPS